MSITCKKLNFYISNIKFELMYLWSNSNSLNWYMFINSTPHSSTSMVVKLSQEIVLWIEETINRKNLNTPEYGVKVFLILLTRSVFLTFFSKSIFNYKC